MWNAQHDTVLTNSFHRMQVHVKMYVIHHGLAETI